MSWEMTTDSEYTYYMDVLSGGNYTIEPLTGGFPYKWNAPQENNIIFPFIIEYKYQNVKYELSFNPNIYTRSGTQTVSDSRIGLSFNYSNNQVTINKITSATGNFGSFTITTIDDNDFPIIIYAAPQDKTKTTYSSPRNITVAGVSYLVQGILYNNCVNMVTSPELSPNLLVLGFRNCTSLRTAPVIPDNVINMAYCFEKCTSLTGDIYVYSQQLDFDYRCFDYTTLPITLHAMNNNIEVCEQLALTADNNVYVNTAPTTLPQTIECSPMNYRTGNDLVQLSPQTDASLVSVQVPNGSGTITTTLEDALVDLYSRMPFIGTTITQPITVSGVTFTPLGYGNIMVNGTSTSYIRQTIIDANLSVGGLYQTSGFSDVVIRGGTIGSNCNVLYSSTGIASSVPNICYGNGSTLTIPTYKYVNNNVLKISGIRIETYIPSNVTFNNIIIKPELRLVGDE